MSAAGELADSFACFGSTCSVLVTGDAPERSVSEAVALARGSLLDWHERFSRFELGSELTRLNGDERASVPVSPLMLRLARSVVQAGALSEGLVDATLVEQIEHAGYDRDIVEPLPLRTALALAPARRAAAAAPRGGWEDIDVDPEHGTVTRAPGIKLDSGGIAKGLFADVLGEELHGHDAYAINCAGDMRLGGAGGVARPVEVQSPFDGSVLHTFRRAAGGVATSGIGRRSWRDRDGRPAHHLLDPSSGRPAFTGIVQVTALADSALTAEIRAKAALLSGPRGARRWLRDGGVVVLDDGSHRVLDPPPTVTLSQLTAFTRGHLSATGRRG
jgi:thiamine biosynthesis lipoprotein